MLETLFTILIAKEPSLSSYTCTPDQLKIAREVNKPCEGEKHFKECYEASIREYCEIK